MMGLYTPEQEFRLSDEDGWTSARWSINVDDRKLFARFLKCVNRCWWWGICSRKFFFESDKRLAIEWNVERRGRDDGDGGWCSSDEHELIDDVVDRVPIILRFVVLLLH